MNGAMWYNMSSFAGTHFDRINMPATPAKSGGFFIGDNMGSDKKYNKRQYSRKLAHYKVGDTCGKCGIDNACHIKRYGAELHVHHIDGDAFNNKIDNLLTLCASCHRLHHIRDCGQHPRAGNVCMVDGCDRPIKSNGYCATHERRYRKYGDPLLTKVSVGRHGNELRRVHPSYRLDTDRYKNTRGKEDG